LPVFNKNFPDAMEGEQHLEMSVASSHTGAFNRLHLRSHFAIFENGEALDYSIDDFVGAPWRFVRLHGFMRRVYEHFPPESDLSNGRMAEWPGVDRAAPPPSPSRGDEDT
jgi:hypothetical protein